MTDAGTISLHGHPLQVVEPTFRTGVLPAAAKELYTALTLEAEDLGAVAQNATERLQSERDERSWLGGQVREFREHYGNRAPHGDREFKRVEAAYKAAQERFDMLARRQGEATARSQAALGLCRRIDDWLGENRDRVITPWQGAAPRLGKGERLELAVERCRKTIADLKREASTVEAAPLTAVEAKAAARAYVAQCAQRGRPGTDTFFAGGSEPRSGDIPAVLAAPVIPGAYGFSGFAGYPGGLVRDAMCFTAWLDPDRLIAAFDRQIDEQADDRRAMTADARVKRRAEIAERILAAERDEEAFVRMALDAGQQIERRPDASPEAVLAVTTLDAEIEEAA